MRFAKKTRELILQYELLGYTIHIGNNPFMDKTKKWAGHDLVKLAQTNCRYSGFCKRTVWASKSRTASGDAP